MGKTNYLQRVNTVLKDNANRLISAYKLRTVLNSGYDDIIEDINELSKTKTFDTVEALQDYATNNPTAYAGQQCSVKADKSVLYIINNDKSLTKVGGGLIIVDTIVERNAIDTKYREIGLKVFVKETTTTYLLKYGITNNYWEEDGLFERESKGKSVIINFTVYSIDITEENVYFFWSTPTTDYCFWVDENGQRPPIVEGRTLIKFTDAQNNILPDDIAQANPFTGSAEIINLSEGECKSPFSAETFAPYISGEVIFNPNDKYIIPKDNKVIHIDSIDNLQIILDNKADKVEQDVIYYNEILDINTISWENDWLKIETTVETNRYNIEDIKCIIETENGLCNIEPIISYPSTPTPDESLFKGLYLRDNLNILSPYNSIDKIYLSFNLRHHYGYNRYNALTELPICPNIIISDIYNSLLEHPYQHSDNCVITAQLLVPEFTGDYIKTVRDLTLQPSTTLQNRAYLQEYCRTYLADIIAHPLQTTAIIETTPDILFTIPHSSNSPTDHNDRGLLNDTDFFDGYVLCGVINNGYHASYGRGIEFIVDNIGGLSQSYACTVIAAQLKTIKLATNVSWKEVRLAARATANNANSWDNIHGFGTIDISAAINYIIAKENDVSKGLADNLDFKCNISNRIKYEDIYETSPLPKKLIQEKLSTKVDLEDGKVISSQIPSNILLNDGSTQMAVTLTYTPIGTVYEAGMDFSATNVNSGNIAFNWDIRSFFSVGDYLKLYSSTLTDIYYVQITQIDYLFEYFVILNYLNIPNFKSNVINRAVKVIRNEVNYTPVEDLDLATKEYVDTKSATYTNSTPVQQALGGISVGETFENISVVKMFDKLLYPYQSPAFSTFSLSNGRTILECGENWNGVTNASFTFTNVSNVKADSLAIYQDATTLVSAQPITSPIAVTLIQANKSVDAQYITMKVQAENTNNILFNRSYNVTWYMPYYFGVGTVGLDVTAIQILTKTITSKANISKTYNTNNQVPYLAYPTSRGLLTSILDKNGYETISDFTRTERTFIINGISVQYYVYEFNNPSTANNLQISYKY